MEPQHPHPRRHRPPHPHLHNILPPPSHIPHRTANSTPLSSPGLFSPSLNRSFPPSQPGSETATPASLNSPYLHPLQGHKVREYVHLGPLASPAPTMHHALCGAWLAPNH